MSEPPITQGYHVRVRYAECDAKGELFPAACLSYFYEAGAASLRDLGIDLQALAAPGGPLRQTAASVSMAKPAHYDQMFEIHTLADAIGPDGFTLKFRMCEIGAQQATGEGRMGFSRRDQGDGAVPALAEEVQRSLRVLIGV